MKLELNSKDCQNAIDKIVSKLTKNEEKEKEKEQERKMKEVSVVLYNTKASSFEIDTNGQKRSFKFESAPTFSEDVINDKLVYSGWTYNGLIKGKKEKFSVCCVKDDRTDLQSGYFGNIDEYYLKTDSSRQTRRNTKSGSTQKRIHEPHQKYKITYPPNTIERVIVNLVTNNTIEPGPNQSYPYQLCCLENDKQEEECNVEPEYLLRESPNYQAVLVLKKREVIYGFLTLKKNNEKELYIDVICSSGYGLILLDIMSRFAKKLHIKVMRLSALPNLFHYYTRAGYHLKTDCSDHPAYRASDSLLTTEYPYHDYKFKSSVEANTNPKFATLLLSLLKKGLTRCNTLELKKAVALLTKKKEDKITDQDLLRAWKSNKLECSRDGFEMVKCLSKSKSKKKTHPPPPPPSQYKSKRRKINCKELMCDPTRSNTFFTNTSTPLKRIDNGTLYRTNFQLLTHPDKYPNLSKKEIKIRNAIQYCHKKKKYCF